MEVKINKEFIITFQPKVPDHRGRRRFSVGGLSLHKYIGRKNANNAISKALQSREDKYTIKLRKFGRIDFYRK